MERPRDKYVALIAKLVLRSVAKIVLHPQAGHGNLDESYPDGLSSA